ncbi:hypothetical protein BJY52DRAFT_1192850 [Lactarius psammicola]|nr:hypothetical protein BJY52DRAFT_1192850 [Lactarius psammicola]
MPAIILIQQPMLFNPPRVNHFCPWDMPSPLAAKHRQLNHSHAKVHGINGLDSSNMEGPAYGSDDAPFLPATISGPPPLHVNDSLSRDMPSPLAAKCHWIDHSHAKVHRLNRLNSSNVEGLAYGSNNMPFLLAAVPGPPPLCVNVSLLSTVPILSPLPSHPLHHPLPPTGHNTNHHWPNSSNNEVASDAKDQSHGSVAMALQNCLCMSPTDSDTADGSSPAGPAWQMGASSMDDLSSGMQTSLVALKANL